MILQTGTLDGNVVKMTVVNKLNKALKKISREAKKVEECEVMIQNNAIKKFLVTCPYEDCVKKSGNYERIKLSLKIERRTNFVDHGNYISHFKVAHLPGLE